MREVKENMKEIILKAQNGDERAFEIIYERLFTPIFRYIYFRVKEVEEAKDLTQVVFIKIYNYLGKHPTENSRPLPYFFTIARNTVIDHWRGRNWRETKTTSSLENLPEIEVSDHNPLEKRELGGLVQSALESLPEAQAEIITLKFISELENKEIAEITGKREEAVRQLQSRGLKNLRKYFEENNLI